MILRRNDLSIRSVTEITKYIKSCFDNNENLQRVLVKGEISNFKKHFSGHCYLTLKDANAGIKAVMFKGNAQFLKFMPENGMEVVASGYITVFERDGQYQLYIDSLFAEGIGEITLAYNKLKEKFTQEGLFDINHKKKLPFLPRKIGVVTSATGAVIQDIMKVVKARCQTVAICLYPVQVQGNEAPQQIIKALDVLNKKVEVDLIIIARGGGSIEDLATFNDEKLVRAIFKSQIPVISAIGHETDFTLSDFVADVRAATPSNAAEIAVPDVKELLKYIAGLEKHLNIAVERIIKDKKNKLNILLEKNEFKYPHKNIEDKRILLDKQLEKLNFLKDNYIINCQNAIATNIEKLSILNPLNILQRGYSIITDITSGKIIDSKEKIKNEQDITIRFKDGEFYGRILKK